MAYSGIQRSQSPPDCWGVLENGKGREGERERCRDGKKGKKERREEGENKGEKEGGKEREGGKVGIEGGRKKGGRKKNETSVFGRCPTQG